VTAGLDPYSKRLIWNLIDKIKNDKVVILTTHSMEEGIFYLKIS
jgi:ATP-binding cassette, subfamily A (ABC1), member 3